MKEKKLDAYTKVERTGGAYSIASNEYLVTFPNGWMTIIWSPPWHDMNPEEEDAGALAHAKELWESGEYILVEVIGKDEFGTTITRKVHARDMSFLEWVKWERPEVELSGWDWSVASDIERHINDDRETVSALIRLLAEWEKVTSRG